MKILRRMFGIQEPEPRGDGPDRRPHDPEAGSAIGHVFEIACDDGRVCFMQHVLNDTTQMNTAVVRVFSGLHDTNAVPPMPQIVSEPTSFYAHVVPEAGLTLQLWRSLGTAPVAPVPRLIWFTPPPRKMRDLACDEWRLWATNEVPETVASSDPRLVHAEFGAAMSPDQILERATSGQWSLPCPTPVGGRPWHFVKPRDIKAGR